MHLARRFLWILGLALLFLPTVLPTQNLMGAAPPPRTPLPPEEWGNLPYQDAPANAAATDPEIATSATFMDWSAVVYEAIADNNWEIYYRDSSREVRLTYHGAMDIHPRLNRGVNKIIFASNRTGNYQLYTMNLDGTSVTQLTSTPADNGNPAWSPDGSKIAFESYRDGQAEIYVMDANGANQRRLTWADGPDTHPTWSPDGTQLAFSSGRTGGYRIWTMQADGNQPRQASTQPYSLYPAWSPDGQWIAYSCDSNNDGWLEAWKVRHDNSAGSVLVYSAQYFGGTTRDVMVRSWAPDGQRVALTQVDMIYYEGEWYWTRTWLLAALASDDVVGLSNTKVGWNPDVQTKDIEQPTATLQALPAYLRAGTQRVRSEVLYDNGPAGGASIELQYRSGDAPWSNVIWTWQSMEFVGYFFHDVEAAAGSTMSFRIRATDQACNTGAWYPNSAGMPVTFYNRQISGQVLDTRATPIYGAGIVSDPEMLEDVTSDLEGRYNGYTIVSGTHTVAVTQMGYGALPITPLRLLADTVKAYVLPPRENLLQNGHFESPLAPAWRVGGSISPTLTFAAAHSGLQAVNLGQAGPEAGLQNISNQLGYDEQPAAVFDAAGNLHIAWTHAENSVYGILVTRCTPALSCDAPQVFSPGIDPVLAAAPDGDVHLVWHRPAEDGIMLAVRNSSGSWSAPSKIADTSHDNASYPDLAIDSSGRLHLIYNYGSTIFYKYKAQGGAWSAAEKVNAENEFGSYNGIEVTPDGVVHVLFQDYTNAALRYRQRSVSGTWSPSEYVGFQFIAWYQVFDMALDHNGTLQVFYSPSGFDGDTRWKSRDASGTWSPESTIASHVYDLNLGVLNDGRLVATWKSKTGEWFMTRSDAAGEWGVPKAIGSVSSEESALAPHPEFAQVALVSSKVVYSDAEIFATIAGVWAEDSGISQIAQTLTLPQELYQPTFSFLYRYESESATSTDTFNVRVQESGQEATLLTVTGATFTPTLADGWAHAWFDMDAWRGKTITVTFALSDTTDGALSWVTLDEVALGAWETPNINAVTPERIEFGATPRITITGGNFIETPVVHFGATPAAVVEWLDAQTLRVTPPAALPFGVHDVSVSNPGGASATQLGGLQVGYRVLLPVVWKVYW